MYIAYNFSNTFSGTASIYGATRAPSPVSVSIRDCCVYMMDIKMNKPYTHIRSGLGLHSAQLADNMSSASQLTTNYTYNAKPTPVTVATGVNSWSGLGGLISINYTNGLIINDANIPLISYVVQGISNNIAGAFSSKSLAITGITMHSVITTDITVLPVVPLFYSLLYGINSNVAVVNGTTYKSLIPIGFDLFKAGTAGTLGNYISIPFLTPIVIPTGGSIALKIQTGQNVSASATGVITYSISFEGYWF